VLARISRSWDKFEIDGLSLVRVETTEQPSLGIIPIVLNRTPGTSGMLGDFRVGHSREEPHLHNFGRAGSMLCEFIQLIVKCQ
jgi:hypothetical protein